MPGHVARYYQQQIVRTPPFDAMQFALSEALANRLDKAALLSAIQGCTLRGSWVNAVCAVLGAEAGKCPRHGTFFDALLDCTSQCRAWRGAVRVLQHWTLPPIAGAPPPRLASNRMHNLTLEAIAGRGGWDAAIAIFADMRRRGLPAEEVTYRALLGACKKDGEWRIAVLLLGLMRADGVLTPGAYTTTMAMCTNSGAWDVSLSLAADLANSPNIGPPVPAAFRELLRATVYGGVWATAISVYRKANDVGMGSNKMTKILTDTMSRKGLWVQATRLVLEQGEVTDATSIAMLMKGCRMSGQWQKAAMYAAHVKANEKTIQPMGPALFTELCHVAIATNTLHTALQYSEGMLISGATVGALIGLLSTLGRWHDAIRVYSRHTTTATGGVNVKFPPDTLDHVMGAFETPRMWRHALKLVDRIRDEGGGVNQGSMEALYRVCERSGYTREMWRWRDFP